MTSSTARFATVADAIEEIRAGRIVVILDSEDRENEGDLVMAAQFATPEAINFMATHGRGLICLALTEERCDQLELPPMASRMLSKTFLPTVYRVPWLSRCIRIAARFVWLGSVARSAVSVELIGAR